MDDYKEKYIKIRKDYNYTKLQLTNLQEFLPYKFTRVIKQSFKNPVNFILSPVRVAEFIISDVILGIVKKKIIPAYNRYLNKNSPSDKIAFVCNLGLVGGTERVMQLHANFAAEKYDVDIFFNEARGPIADELRQKFKVDEGQGKYKILSYKLLRYKYIYLAQSYPNIRYIKEANPDARISFILHEHLSGWLETFEEDPNVELLDHIFCISNLVREKFLAKVPWYPEERVSVLYNPSFNGNEDMNRIVKRNTAPENFVIGYYGRVSPEKNTLGLVRIFNEFNKNHPNVKLIIAGPLYKDVVPEYDELFRSEIAQNPNIEYVGPINGKDQMTSEEFFNKIDGLAFSSFIEGIALTATEAMSFGLPVLSTNVGAHGEIIEEGFNGNLVDIEPITFNPFVELHPPFKFLTDKDMELFAKKLEVFINTKWDNAKIAEKAISIFGKDAAKERLLTGIEKIIKKEPVRP